MVAFSSPISDLMANISLSFSNEDLTTNENKLSPSISGMEEGLSKVFREYEQAERSTSAKHGGTGLGLPITKKLAEMMGGDVIVTSELGVGSVFTLYVPRECPQELNLLLLQMLHQVWC